MKRIVLAAAALFISVGASYAQERLRDGAIGAVGGAIVGGPVGAAVGGVGGYIAGPAITRAVSPRRHYYRRHYVRRHHARRHAR